MYILFMILELFFLIKRKILLYDSFILVLVGVNMILKMCFFFYDRDILCLILVKNIIFEFKLILK